MIAPPGCECQPEEPPGWTVICAMATSVPTWSGMVPCDAFVPRASGTCTNADGGVAAPGATIAAATTPATPTLSSVHLRARCTLLVLLPPPSQKAPLKTPLPVSPPPPPCLPGRWAANPCNQSLKAPPANVNLNDDLHRGAFRVVSLASAVLGNGAAVGLEDGDDHANVEPVWVGYGAGDREHPERGVGVGHVA